MALYNQSEASTSDLSDDQSRYFFYNIYSDGGTKIYIWLLLLLSPLVSVTFGNFRKQV